VAHSVLRRRCRRRRVLVSRNIKTSHQINVDYAKRKAQPGLFPNRPLVPGSYHHLLTPFATTH